MTEHQPVRIGMIGCGAIAEIFHLPALQRNPMTATGIALADPNQQRLDAMKDLFGARFTVTDFHQFQGHVDGVIVATPPALHHPICKWFLERGVHVLCEKPLTESLTEAQDLVAIAKSNNVSLAVNQTRRFFPTYAKIRELIADGTLGTLQSITYHEGAEFDWPAATPHHFSVGAKGAWSDTGVHLIDSIGYWLGAEPELIESWNDSHGGPEALATVRLRHKQCDIEIKLSRLGRLPCTFCIKGSQATIQASVAEWSKVVVEFNNGKTKTYRCGSNKAVYKDFADPMIDNFVKVIHGTAEPTVSGHSTLGTIELLESAYEKARPFEMPWNGYWQSGHSEFSVDQEDAPQRVLVTGASGFLGGRIVEALHMSQFATPVAAIRKWTRAARVARYPVELALCDIQDRDQVDQAVAGVDAIVHCAKTDDRDSIVGGTRNLLDAAQRHGIERFVFLSTAEVYGPGVSGTIDESAATPFTGRLYGDSKVEAEQVCREFYDRGVEATILRPSIIYGPFSASWSVSMAKRLQSGNWGMFDEHGDGIANLIYVDDLVRAIFLSLSHPAAVRETFNVNGPDRVTWNQYFSRFNDALELPPLRTVSAAKSRLRTMLMDKVDAVADVVVSRFEDKLMEIYMRGGPAGRLMKWVKSELSSTPSGNELNDLFARDAIYTDAKIRQRLGFESAFDLTSGLKNTVDWMRVHSLAKPSLRMPAAHDSALTESRSSQMEATAR